MNRTIIAAAFVVGLGPAWAWGAETDRPEANFDLLASHRLAQELRGALEPVKHVTQLDENRQVVQLKALEAGLDRIAARLLIRYANGEARGHSMPPDLTFALNEILTASRWVNTATRSPFMTHQAVSRVFEVVEGLESGQYGLPGINAMLELRARQQSAGLRRVPLDGLRGVVRKIFEKPHAPEIAKRASKYGSINDGPALIRIGKAYHRVNIKAERLRHYNLRKADRAAAAHIGPR